MFADLNKSIFLFLNKFLGGSPSLDNFWIFCASYLGWIMLFGLILYILFAPPRRKGLAFLQMLVAFTTAVFAWFIFSAIKYGMYNPRPYEVIKGVEELIRVQGGDAFPSSHAVFFSSLAFAMFNYNKRWGWVFIVLAGLVGLGRIMTKVHWPFDVIAGFIIGWLGAWLVHRILQYLKKTA